jgi:hypothetical protein
MDVYEKTFDRVVALAIVQQQELAVACGAIAARAREDMREAWREAAEATTTHALMLVSLNLSMT